MDKVRLAIVGCGTISQMNAPGYLTHDKCEVTALCDPLVERAKERAKDWGIEPRIHTSYEDALNDANVDAVELLTPTFLHCGADHGGTGRRQARFVPEAGCGGHVAEMGFKLPRRWRGRTLSFGRLRIFCIILLL